MKSFSPSVPFDTPMFLLAPSYHTVKGVRVKAYPDTSEVLIYGSFRTFGGTETKKNDVLAVEDTATIETWFNPEIRADCAVELANSGERYEILGSPENIGMRNQYHVFKVRRIGGGA